MSDFKCEVMKVDAVEKHPDADRLSIVKIRGYNCITANLEDGSPRYKAGDLVVYIPEAAVLPQALLDTMGFVKDGKNMLAGSNGDRVKAIKLRGIVSQGLLYPVAADGRLYPPLALDNGFYAKGYNVSVGDDVAAFMQITKWEPPVPLHMQGEVVNVGTELTVKYDIENFQKYPDVIIEGEICTITEKLHGTFCALAYVPHAREIHRLNRLIERGELLTTEDGAAMYAFSKGLGSQGLVFKNVEANNNNIYHKTLLKYKDNLERFAKTLNENLVVIVLGEVYGAGVQDLHYDATKEPNFRVFDIHLKERENLQEHMTHDVHKSNLAPMWDLVPILYRGPFSVDEMIAHRDGKTKLGGDNIREGVVVKLLVERNNPQIGRVILKAVSPEYLLRKGNATEFN